MTSWKSPEDGSEWEPIEPGEVIEWPPDLCKVAILRKVEPEPMPEIQVGDGVKVGNDGRFVITSTSNTYSRYSGYSPYGEYTTIEPHEIQTIWRDGKIVWVRKQ